MKTLFLLLVSTALGIAAHAQTPLFKKCEKADNPQECSQIKYQEFLLSVKEEVMKDQLLPYGEQLNVSYSIDSEGNLIIDQSQSFFTSKPLKILEKKLKKLENALSPENAGKSFTALIENQLPRSYQSFPRLHKDLQFPMYSECAGFKPEAHVGCFRYFVDLQLNKLRQVLNPLLFESFSGRLFFADGHLAGVSINNPPSHPEALDLFLKSYRSHFKKRIRGKQLRNKDSFFVEFDFSASGTLTETQLEAQKSAQLNRLKNWPDKSYFLRTLFSYAPPDTEENRRVRNDFLVKNLDLIGFGSVEGFYLDERYISIDSLRTLQSGKLPAISRKESYHLLEVKFPPRIDGGNNQNKEFALACFANHATRLATTQFNYPEMALSFGIQGTIIVGFEIDAEAQVTNIRIIQFVDPLVDLEAINAVSKFRGFQEPDTIKGKPVKVQYRLYINLQLL